VSFMYFLGGSISFASTPLIQDDIQELKNLGYTGKGVKVGVLDGFLPNDAGLIHGLEVAKFIHAVAPDAHLITESADILTGDDTQKSSILYSVLSHFIHEFHMTSFQPSCVVALKSDLLSTEVCESLCRNTPNFDLYAASPARFSQYDLVTFAQGESLLFKANDAGDVFFFDKGGREYAVLVGVISGVCHFHWHFKGEELLSILKTMPNLVPLKEKISKLTTQGATIINASLGLNMDYVDVLGAFWQSGGVFVQSAGNEPVELGSEKINFRRLFDEEGGVAHTLIDSLRWNSITSQESRSGHVLVGQFDEKGRRYCGSAMAGRAHDLYLGCVLKPENALTGTSFTAPQVTGLFALLKEAYPSVDLKTIRKALMSTATPLAGDTEKSEGGNGCVNPMTAFKAVFEMTGVLPLGEKGQEALLPTPFHEEVYLACNHDLLPFVPQGSPQGRKSWLQRHYLLHGKKESRFYGSQFLPASFSATLYLAGYSDLRPFAQDNPEKWAFYHYVMHGRHEMRLCGEELLPPGFNADAYLALNKDVSEAVPNGTNPREFAMVHYLQNGKNEGRRYKA